MNNWKENELTRKYQKKLKYIMQYTDTGANIEDKISRGDEEEEKQEDAANIAEY